MMSSKDPDSAPGITRFPSADLWEGAWEPNLDLRALRKRSGNIRANLDLAEKLNPELIPSGPTREQITHLLGTLRLEKEQSSTLIEDAWLIGQWYHWPKFSAQVFLGREHEISQLREAGRLAALLYPLLGGISAFVESIAEDLKITMRMVTPERSLMTFADEIGSIEHVANEILRILKPAGRPVESRRNIVIVLASQAVEEASGIQIATGRDSKARAGEHFTNAPGQFLAKLMNLICRSSETVVAGAFIDLRRPIPET